MYEFLFMRIYFNILIKETTKKIKERNMKKNRNVAAKIKGIELIFLFLGTGGLI